MEKIAVSYSKSSSFLKRGDIALLVDSHGHEECLWCQGCGEGEVYGYTPLKQDAEKNGIKIIVGCCGCWEWRDSDERVVIITHEEAEVLLLPKEHADLQLLLSHAVSRY